MLQCQAYADARLLAALCEEPLVTETPKDQVSWKGCFGCLGLVLAAAGALYVYGFISCNPSDGVLATFRNIPAGTVRLSVVVESHGTLDNMHWLIQYGVGAPFPKRPGALDFHELEPPVHDVTWYVQWKQGDRFGVVVQRDDRSWWVTWFDADAVPVSDQTPVLGGRGRAIFDLNNGRPEPFPLEKVKDLGLTSP